MKSRIALASVLVAGVAMEVFGGNGCAIPRADMIAEGGPDLTHRNMFSNFEVESFPATDLAPR